MVFEWPCLYFEAVWLTSLPSLSVSYKYFLSSRGHVGFHQRSDITPVAKRGILLHVFAELKNMVTQPLSDASPIQTPSLQLCSAVLLVYCRCWSAIPISAAVLLVYCTCWSALPISAAVLLVYCRCWSAIPISAALNYYCLPTAQSDFVQFVTMEGID